MKQITIQVPDNKVHFFMELIRNLKFIKEVTATDEPTKEEILAGLEDAVQEVNLIKAGKKTGKPLKDFLDEL